MTGPMWMAKDVAARRRPGGVKVGTIYRYLVVSRRRIRDGLPLRETDMPLPDQTRYGHPVWDPSGPIVVWLARTADPADPAGHEPARKDTP